MPSPTPLSTLKLMALDDALGFIGDCPECADELSYARDEAGKRNVCLTCGHSISDTTMERLARFPLRARWLVARRRDLLAGRGGTP